MPVTQADLVLKKSAVSSDDPALNGGPISDTPVGSNLFPDISGNERSDGVTRWRKFFLKNEAGDGAIPDKVLNQNLGLIDSKVFLLNNSAAGDYYLIKEATTKTGAQSAETDAAWSGTGVLKADALVAATSLTVVVEATGQGTGNFFQIGKKVLITDGTSREFVTLSGVSWPVTTEALLTFTSTPLQHAYTAFISQIADIATTTTIGKATAGMAPNAYFGKRVTITSGTGVGQTRRIISNTDTTLTVEYAWTTIPTGATYKIHNTMVCQCVSLGTLICSSTAPVVTGGGAYTPGTTLYPIGCIDENWDLLFSSNTNFTLTGLNVAGNLGVFSISTDVQPSNGASYYFKMASTGFNTSFVAGSRITFSTVSASGAVWMKEVVPPGVAAHLSNSIDIGASGDTI